MRKVQVSTSFDPDLIERFDEQIGRRNRSALLSQWIEAFLDDRLKILSTRPGSEDDDMHQLAEMLK